MYKDDKRQLVPPRLNSEKLTKILIICSIIFGPFFYLIFVVQVFIRRGYDIRVHPLSLLALGELGWIQTSNFIITGVLAILGSIGMKKELKGAPTATTSSLLLLFFGVGMIIAGIFKSDPSLGFPPGSPDSVSTTLSTHAMLHGFGFFVAFGSLTLLSYKLSVLWNSQENHKMANIGRIVAIMTPLLIFIGMITPPATSIIFAITGLPPFALVSIMGVQMYHRQKM